MNKKDILKLNCKVKENRESMHCMLKELKPFRKVNGSLKLSHLEKAIYILCKKHNVNIELYLDYYSGDSLIYHCMVKSQSDCFSVHTISMYELYAKILIYFFKG